MDKPLGKSSGEITIDVHLNGLDEQLARAQELVDTIKRPDRWQTIWRRQ